MDGTPFGRYRLVELLGRGGMGVVWRAYDTFTDRVVAIKVLPAHLSDDEEFQQRFRREAHAAARLNNPHIIPIHNYGEIDGSLYVDMRLIEGRDLHAVLGDGPMATTRAVRIIEQVAKALNAAHRIGLVHRDVKPSNILVDEDDFAYLIDFGIARETGQKKLTRTGYPIGTWAYMSPERMRDGPVDARADIYALACVLYECLTGRQPFPGDSFESQALAHLTDPPPQPSITQPNVPPKVDEVIATGMAKYPDQRYDTTLALADAARDAITVPIPGPESAPTRIRAYPTPSPTPAPAANQYRQPPSWNPQGATWHHDEASARPAADFEPNALPSGPISKPQSGRRTGLIAAIVTTVVAVVGGVIFFASYLVLHSQHASGTSTPQSANPTYANPTSGTTQLPPLPPNALNGLLLSVDNISSAMDSTAMSPAGTMTTMPDFSSRVPDRPCLALAYAVQAEVYAGSGSSAMRAEVDEKPQQNAVTQAVVLFASPQDADSFFTASIKSWMACSARQFTISMNGNSQVHTVGPVATTNGTLSATVTPAGALGFCERALTVASNVAIDVATCAGPPGAAVNIAHQIAAKVSKAQ